MSAKHIGFIMDGNGRWAVAHGMSRAEGYAHGLVALYKVAKRCSERGVEAVSVYALSTENLNRPEEELQAIFKVVEKFNLTYDGEYKISYMGDFNSLDDKLASSIEQIEEKTRDNKGMWLNIAFNYGAKADILHAAKVAYDHGEFLEDTFEKHLSSSHLPPLDLIVRSGGEMRLSNSCSMRPHIPSLCFWTNFGRIWTRATLTESSKILTNASENSENKIIL